MPIDAVIDVGAHEGEFVRMMRDLVRFQGPIISFEPSAASFATLRRTMATDSAWTGHQFALGAAECSTVLNTFAGSTFNSLLTPNDVGRQRFTDLSRPATETVTVRRLDSFPEVGRRLLLKIDTQGFDLRVIEGASAILPKVDAIVMEVPVQPIYDGATKIVPMLQRMDDLGFELLGLFPLSRRRDRLRVVEFDGVFVRSNAEG